MNKQCHYPDCKKKATGKAVWCGRLHRVAGNRLIKAGRLSEPESTKSWRQRDTYRNVSNIDEISIQKTMMELQYEQLLEQRELNHAQQETNYLLRELLQNGIYANPAQPAPRMQQAAPRANGDAIIIEDDAIKAATADADNNSGHNFLIAAALQSLGNYDSLRDDIIEYGIRTKRIPVAMIPARYKAIAVPNYPLHDKELREIAEADGNPRALAGAGVVFAEPEEFEFDLN